MNPNNRFRREFRGLKPSPVKAIPGTIQSAYKKLPRVSDAVFVGDAAVKV